MADIDHVFARFNRGASNPNECREQLTVRGRAGATGTRTVEVVRIRSGGSAALKSEPRADRQVRAVSWENGFPAKPAAVVPAAAEATPSKPVSHVMPAWEPTPIEISALPKLAETVAPHPRLAAVVGRQTRSAPRRVADPFDAGDDGASCMRCGYAVEPARGKRRQGRSSARSSLHASIRIATICHALPAGDRGRKADSSLFRT